MTTPDKPPALNRCSITADGVELCDDGRALNAGIIRSEALGMPADGMRRNLDLHLRGSERVEPPTRVARPRGARR